MSDGLLSPLVETQSYSTRVTQVLRAAILSGELKQGQVLVEREVAAMLGVSKTPVREALISLTSSGLVVGGTGHRPLTVRELSTTDVTKVYEIRLLLEPWAVGGTARRESAQHTAEARGFLSQSQTLLDTDNWQALALANRGFHRALYSGCDNELVVEHLDGLQDLTALGIASILWKREPTWRIECEEHEEILRTVESGDAGAAQAQMANHIQNGLTRLLDSAPSEPESLSKDEP